MKVGEKTNLSDLPLFVWCILTLALKCIDAVKTREIYSFKQKQKITKH